jgi:hypothetical protein
LIAALGLTTAEDDADGELPGGPTISEEQASRLDVLLNEVKADGMAFLKFAGVSKLLDIKQNRYESLLAAIEHKRQAIDKPAKS